MINNFLKINKLFNRSEDKFLISGLNEVLQSYSFIHISKETTLSEDEKQKIFKFLGESKAVIVDQKEILNQKTKKQYLILGFEKTVIIIEKASTSILRTIFPNKNNIATFYISESIHTDQMISLDSTFLEEIQSFNDKFIIIKQPKEIKEIWSIIVSCISGYLIKKSYFQKSQDRIEKFIKEFDNNQEQEIINKKDYIVLRNVGIGSLFKCDLIYHVKRGELYVLKTPYGSDTEIPTLREREYENYKNIRHPLLPKFYGRVKDTTDLVIEFINGQSLMNINKMKLTYSDKLTIIFELMLIIHYFHENELIYRDLKPNNVIFDENKTVVLIDFDRLVKNNNDEKRTLDFSSAFMAPEIMKTGEYSYKSDIYSLGKMIDYVINKSIDDKEEVTRNSEDYLIIDNFIQKCIDEVPENRPQISTIIHEFYYKFKSKIQFQFVFNQQTDDTNISTPNYRSNQNLESNSMIIHNQKSIIKWSIEKTIQFFPIIKILNTPLEQNNYNPKEEQNAICKSSPFNYENQKDTQAQFRPGAIYHESKYVTQDINKSIHYYSLAADQNDPRAQFNLGIIYYEGEYVTRDINKSIHYYSLAANQNYPEAQFNLGAIYYEGEYVTRDINKSIYYYSLAANQNYPQAQFNLGRIYYEGLYVTRDINKSIHYYSLAADQNHPEAQFNLGVIYYEGEYVTRDINKSIHYYSLAANQNYPRAQFNLGVIYYKGLYVARDINKSIHYLSLAANQNYPRAQFNLGRIYYEGLYVTRDINKSIHCFSLAADLKNPMAQFNLGVIYYKGLYVARDINKSIHFFSLAANQNHSQSQFRLGLIFCNNKINKESIKKSRYYIMLASKNDLRLANFSHGFLLHEGKYGERNIEEAIHYYKEASSFDIQYAKNNLGVIYRHGYDKVAKRIGNAIEYFEEAIRQENEVCPLLGK